MAILAYKVLPIQNRTISILNQFQETQLTVSLVEDLYKKHKTAQPHVADIGFFQRDDKNIQDLARFIRIDIQAYLKLINQNLPTLRSMNAPHKELALRFMKAMPIGANEKQRGSIEEAFLDFFEYVKENTQDNFIDHFKPSDHEFLGYGIDPMITLKADRNKYIFRTDMPLPYHDLLTVVNYPIQALGTPTDLVGSLEELKALEFTLQSAYRKLVCGLTLKTTLYAGLDELITKEYLGDTYLTPHYDETNTDIVSLLISMVIRLRLGVLRFLYRLAR